SILEVFFTMKKVVSLLVAMFLIASLFVAFAEVPVEVLDNPYLVLVNKTTKLPNDWTNMVSFSVGKNSLGELYIVESKALEAFEALRAYLLEEKGVQIELDSVYRSLEEQQDIWDAWSADPEKGVEYCEQYLAPVGCSEHHTGLAIDVFLVKDGEIIRDNDAMIAETEAFAKIHQHLAKFGFILRYLPEKEDITGYSYEPWHFRYIGNPALAQSIMTAKITFEEYHNLLQSTFN
ncbi:M15 family metallopeptidase, partial [Candidatus Saccharibacteria bacterium]|nr:M15 family metallopeptidase [Candidatus Saccharibacteria bacterium]